MPSATELSGSNGWNGTIEGTADGNLDVAFPGRVACSPNGVRGNSTRTEAPGLDGHEGRVTRLIN